MLCRLLSTSGPPTHRGMTWSTSVAASTLPLDSHTVHRGCAWSHAALRLRHGRPLSRIVASLRAASPLLCSCSLGFSALSRICRM